ncbi:hypothetical protein AAK894_02720 [Lachnospiraceae bacterium 46-61]
MIDDVFLNKVINLKSKIDKEKSFHDGVKTGAKKQKIEILIAMYNKGYDIREISSIIDLPISDTDRIIAEYELRKKSGVNVMPVSL